MTPPIADRLLAEPRMECVEGYGEIFGPLLPSLMLKWLVIEEGALLGVGRQPRQAQCHPAKSNSAAKTSLEKRGEQG